MRGALLVGVTIAIINALFDISSPDLARAENKAVREDLATMVEEVGVQTGISFNISDSTPTSVNIDQVNGRNVCSTDARADVERLQRAFDSHPSIYRNIGPVFIIVTDRDGKKTSGDPAKLATSGILKGCPSIYVSVHEP